MKQTDKINAMFILSLDDDDFESYLNDLSDDESEYAANVLCEYRMELNRKFDLVFNKRS